MKQLLLLCQILVTSAILTAQPVPGDLYKEYTWFNRSGDCNGALRVGGSLDYRIIEVLDDYRGEGLIAPPFEVNLDYAIKAELVVEKMLCHGGTEGLRVSINGREPIRVPEAEQIPSPPSAYAHHFNAVVAVPLAFLEEGTGNTFSFEVDTAGHWWPQNLVYGMILRIYYPDTLLKDKSSIAFPENSAILGISNRIKLELAPGEKIEKIELVGHYEGEDMEGDGIYRQWHYGYHQCRMYNQIATLTQAPFEFIWNTEWIPDQAEPMNLAAFVHRTDGYIYMTDAVQNLQLQRPGISVELCKPYKRPQHWFTRNGEFSERFRIRGNLEQAVEARMVFRTWSPGYFNGIYINDFLVFVREGPRYDYFEHDIPVTDLYVLQQGENILKTGMTPKYNGTLVHGVEVQWPGIMLLIKYDLARTQ